MKIRGERLLILYWFLLIYIIAALVFWFFELEKQNRRMTEYKLSELVLDDPSFNEKYDAIIADKERKSAQFIGEGVTFFGIIIVGAVVMFRAVRKQFALQKQQKNFMMAVTHELKTPIAIAKLNLETLQKHQLDEPKKEKILQMTLQEVNRLNSLASNILVSAQLEGAKSSAKEELDFSALVTSCVHDFASRFPDRAWDTDIEEDADLMGDSFLLQMLVNNLLENAVKYSPPRTRIHCQVRNSTQGVKLTVGDEGPGIPLEERKKVFDKFYRIGNEQTRSAKGTGLGLYLCSKIAREHDAGITIADNKPKGALFVVQFHKS